MTLRMPCHVTSDGVPAEQSVGAGEVMSGWPMASPQQSPECGECCCLTRTGQSDQCYQARLPRPDDSLGVHFAQRQTRPRWNRRSADIRLSRFNMLDVGARRDRRIPVTAAALAVCGETIWGAADHCPLIGCRSLASHRARHRGNRRQAADGSANLGRGPWRQPALTLVLGEHEPTRSDRARRLPRLRPEVGGKRRWG